MSRKTRVAAMLVAAAFATEGSMAADRCASSREVATLKVAALQQQLMVAALTCHEIGAYNRFVLSYRPELQRSDREMLDLFQDRDGSRAGDAAYNAFKTRLANLAVLRNNDEDTSFCAQAHAEFRAAAENRAPLAEFVQSVPVSADLPFDDCSGVTRTSAVMRDRSVFHHGVFDSGSEGRDDTDRTSDEDRNWSAHDGDRPRDGDDAGWSSKPDRYRSE
jgi:hypothetical protein